MSNNNVIISAHLGVDKAQGLTLFTSLRAAFNRDQGRKSRLPFYLIASHYATRPPQAHLFTWNTV